jgi:hypothetical protein
MATVSWLVWEKWKFDIEIFCEPSRLDSGCCEFFFRIFHYLEVFFGK